MEQATEQQSLLLAPLLRESRVVEGGDDALRISIALREAMREPGQCVVRRTRPGNLVALVSTVEGHFVVRAFEAGLLARLFPRRFCQSGMEWRALWSCVDLGLPCARPVALLASREGRSVNYLVVERGASVAPLSVFVEREQDRLLAEVKFARSLIRGLAAFVAKLHRAGMLTTELRLENVGVRAPKLKSETFEFSLFEVGLQSATGAMPVESARLANLGEFAVGFGNWPATWKIRFLREYQLLTGDSADEHRAVRMISERAVAFRFERNTRMIANCGEASSTQARVERPGHLLLINRLASDVDLEQLEDPLSNQDPEQWEGLLLRHYELRLGAGNVCRLIGEFPHKDAKASARRLEAIWGRLLELGTLDVHSPAPLACLVTEGRLVALGRVGGRLEPLARQDDRDWRLIDDLARDLVRLHSAGCFFMPMEPAELLSGLSVSLDTQGGRTLVLSAPDHLFRGSPTLLGMQAVASLGRVARAILDGRGDRAMKELIWTYARLLRLNTFDTQMLMDEACRVPTGRTLVVTRGLKRSAVARGARP